jgi:hypothetical protein
VLVSVSIHLLQLTTYDTTTELTAELKESRYGCLTGTLAVYFVFGRSDGACGYIGLFRLPIALPCSVTIAEGL